MSNLGGQVEDAQAAVDKANTQADRDAAQARLAALQKAQFEAQQRANASRRPPRRIVRNVSRASRSARSVRRNPLARGCT